MSKVLQNSGVVQSVTITDSVLEKIAEITRKDIGSDEVKVIANAFKRASQYQQSVYQQQTYRPYTRTELRQSIESINGALKRVLRIVNNLSHTDERLFDDYYWLANNRDRLLMGFPPNLNGNCGYFQLIEKILNASKLYEQEILKGKQPDRTHSKAIEVIIIEFSQLFPKKNPMGKSVSDEQIICQLVMLWLTKIENKQVSSVKAKVEAVTLFCEE